VSSPGNASEFAAELAILRDEGPPLDDPDPASLAEREVNRRWAAIRRLGENHIYAADDLVRRQLYATDPSLRAEAIHVLLGIWRRMDLLGHAINIAASRDEDPMVRMVAMRREANPRRLERSGSLGRGNGRHCLGAHPDYLPDPGSLRRNGFRGARLLQRRPANPDP
jgi:hypothetical protein